MKKVIIGILGTSEYMKTNDAFYDVYKYSNNYIKKIVENDAVPLLIPLVDDKLIEETLDMCDGLLLPGGSIHQRSKFQSNRLLLSKKETYIRNMYGYANTSHVFS